MDEAIRVGERVVVTWGISEVLGTVAEVYGSGRMERYVVQLTPDLSGDVVDEATTVSLPLDYIRRPTAA